jgi:iron complex transport system substrate-binding protein
VFLSVAFIHRAKSILLAALLLSCVALPQPTRAAEPTQTVVDSAGRKITLPAEITRVLAAGPPAAVLLYSLAPDALIGWPHKLGAEALAMLPTKYASLPVVGAVTGRHDPLSPDAIAALRPEIIVDVGTVDPGYAALADKIQQATGIPYLLIDGSLEQSAATYRKLGPVLGQAERAEALAQYAERALAAAAAAKSKLGPDRPRIYYGRGADGLDTPSPGSIIAEIFEAAGAENIAPGTGKNGLVKVTIEQVAQWAPAMALTSAAEVHQTMLQDAKWQAVPALREHRVYLAPAAPFGWIDEPPSVNRLLGLHWLAGILADGRPPADMRSVARDFYRQFYRIELGDEQLDHLLPAATN